MKAYLVVTGILFGLVTIAHVLRVVMENPRLAIDPFYILLTLASAALCTWAFVLLLRSRRRS